MTPLFGLIALLLIVAMVIGPAMSRCEPVLPEASNLPSRRGTAGDTLGIDYGQHYYLNKRHIRYAELALALARRPKDRPLYFLATAASTTKSCRMRSTSPGETAFII